MHFWKYKNEKQNDKQTASLGANFQGTIFIGENRANKCSLIEIESIRRSHIHPPILLDEQKMNEFKNFHYHNSWQQKTNKKF